MKELTITFAVIAVTLAVVYTFGEKVEPQYEPNEKDTRVVQYHPDDVVFAVAMCDADRKWKLKNKELTPAEYMGINCQEREYWVKHLPNYRVK